VETETSKSIEMSVDNEENSENPEPFDAGGRNIYLMQLHARSGWVDKGMDMTPRFMKFLGFLMKFLGFLMKRHVKFKVPKKYGQHVIGKLVAQNSGCSWGGLRKDFIPLPMYEGVYIKESWTTRLSDHLFDDPDLLWVKYS